MDDSVSPETVATFGLLRLPSSRIMTLPSIGASNAQEVATDFKAIHSILTRMPDPQLHLTTKLISYLQHALNHVLTLCHQFLAPEKRFDYLVDAWCTCLEFLLRLPDGYAVLMGSKWEYDRILFEVLFRAVDGWRVDPKHSQQQQQQQRAADPAAVAKDRMPDETRLVALRCLILLLPLDKQAPGILELTDQEIVDQGTVDASFEYDRELRTPADEMVRGHLMEASSRAVLGQLIVIMLDAATEAKLVTLRTTALEGVMKLLHCLETQERVAAWVPGILSGLTKVMLARGLKEHHAVLAKAIYVWTFMVVFVLKDHTMSSKGAAGLADLSGEGLMKMYQKKMQSSGPSNPRPQPTDQSYGTDAWLKQMQGGLKTLFKHIAPLRTHAHWMVRLKFGEMAFKMLKDCQTLIAQHGGAGSGGVACFLLETLIGCSQDDFQEVYQPARAYLSILTDEYTTLALANVAKEIMREKLMALPRVLHGADESVKQEAIKIAQGLSLFLDTHMEALVNYQTLWGYVQAWIGVLTIDQLDQHTMDERRGLLSVGNKGDVASATPEENRWVEWVQSNKASGRKFDFPRKIHLYLREQATSLAFLGFLRQLGSTTEINVWSEELLTRIQEDSRGVRENLGWYDAGTVSCVVMMNQLLIGAAGIGLATFGDSGVALGSPESTKENESRKKPSDKKAASLKRKHERHVRKAARGILQEYLAVMIECSQMSLEAKARQEAEIRARSDMSAASSRKAIQSSLEQFFDAEEGFEQEEQESRIYDYKTEEMLQCVLLEGIASVAVILGQAEFEMEMVRVLYVLLEHLGDQDSAIVRDTAEATLEHVAFICQYESIGDLVQANYDYVIQQVSQRISFLSTNPKTPQVLWALIHIVGPPAISMLEDSVTEIFEALDHWKNQEDQVGEGLMKSLSEIVRVMAQAVRAEDQKEASLKGSKRDSGVGMSKVQFSDPKKPSEEVALFAKSYQLLIQGADATREEEIERQTRNMTPGEVKDYFLKLAKDAKAEEEKLFGQRQGDMEDEDEEELSEDGQEDLTSFGDLRAKMPKTSKESKQNMPTAHQALCLRILNKAGYFLTASSPRMRILALETIQGSIIVLKDRPLELNPAMHEFWPAIVNRVLKRSELEVFYVSLRAIEVVTLLAENAGDFLGRHLLNDVWPFISKAFQTWTRPSLQSIKDSGQRSLGKTVYQASKPSASSEAETSTRKSTKARTRQPLYQGRRGASTKVFTREHRLQLATLQSVSKIVAKVRVPVQELWEMLLLAKEMMLDRYWVLHWDVRVAASEVIQNMARAGHGDSVWLVLSELVEELEVEDRKTDHGTVGANGGGGGHGKSGQGVGGGGRGDSEGERPEEVKDETLRMCKDILALMTSENL